MRKKLLVVDDQPGMTRVVALVAGSLGFETRAVNCPFEAIDAFLDFEPDIVMIDMIMPEKDGIDVLHEILVTGRACRIIIMSGLSEAYLRLSEGIARFYGRDVSVLRKPFRRNELASLLLANEALQPVRRHLALVVSA
jgi:two-component system alkaline phosphatase synthesis response regulator PhoP